MNNRVNIALILAVVFLPLFSGCGPGYQFSRAERLEEKGYFVEAGMKYDEIARSHPRYERSPEAYVRAGRIYQKRLKLYSQATAFFKQAVERYPGAQPWVEQAQRGMLDSPDYFPLTAGSFWIEGDSETGGRNMRAEWSCTEVSSGTFCIQRRLFAGRQLVTSVKRYYRQRNFEVREYDDPRDAKYRALLAYPFFEGKSWTGETAGRRLVLRIVSRNIAVKVKAGEFSGCIKVSEVNPELPGSVKYNYYAPEVGWILTTISAGGKEHENSELISYRIVPEEWKYE